MDEKEVFKSTKNINNKKIKVSNIFLYSSIILTFLYLVFIITSLVLDIKSNITIYDTNYIFDFIMVLVATILFIILLFTEKKLDYPEWLKCFLISIIIISCLVYSYFNLYTYTISSIIIFIILSLSLYIVAISIFFNNFKDNDDKLKTKPFILSLFSSMFTITIGTVIELIICLVKLIEKKLYIISNNQIIELASIVISSIVFSVVFIILFNKNKKIINNLLIIRK